MKTEEVHSQNSRKLVFWVVGILIAILMLGPSIYKLRKSENWESYTTQNSGLVHNTIRTIAIDSSDRVWIGTELGGVSVFDGENWESYTTLNSGLVSDRVDTMAIDSSDRVWIGTSHGISVFDGDNWLRFTTHNSGLDRDNIGAIAIDSAGQVWVGVYVGLSGGGGTTKRDVVSVFDGKNWEGYTSQNSGLVSDWVNTIAIDSSDRVWVGTAGGVSVFDGENWVTNAEYNSGLLSERVESIAADKKGNIWIGTNGGINRVPEGERLQVTPFFTSIRDLFFSPKFSLWFNLLLLIFLGTVALVVIDRRRAIAEQEPTSGRIQPEEKEISKPSFGSLGAAGGFTVSIIACLFAMNNITTDGGLELIVLIPMQIGIAVLGIPVSLVLGPVAGMLSGRVFKTKSAAFLSGFLVQLIFEVPLIWVFFNG